MKAVLVLSILLFQGSLGDLIVQTQNGLVRGTTFNGPNGQTFYTWRGMPFAKAPVGSLRYLPPVKPDTWPGVLDATKDSPACIFFGTFFGDPTPLYGNSEDCLYINVYSPAEPGSNVNASSPRAVLFWIYGGGFYSGFSDFSFYDPTPFLEDDVIVVTFNYRLGTLGFLSTEDEVILGNAGLKDQLLALQWTKDNIAAFGGSPEDITIFGESAGAISVGYHLVSPVSRTLFKGAIMQSGCSIANLLQSNARDFAFNIASQLDSSITSRSTSEQVKNVLQAAPVNFLQYLTNGMVLPVIEVESRYSFLADSLYESVESGNFAHVPTIIGYNSEEALGMGNDTSMYEQMATMYDMYQQALVPSNLKLRGGVSPADVGQEIHQQYVGSNYGRFSENLATYFEFSSDNMFGRSSNQQAVLQSRFSPVYLYEFSYYGTLSQGNLIVPGAGKVSHAQEVGYQFNISTKVITTQKDYLARKRFVKLWTNFAKFGDPTPNDDSAELLQHVKWLPITENNITYLNIDEDLKVKHSHKHDKTVFWQDLWEKYSYRPYVTF